jgi:hypothetical protein
MGLTYGFHAESSTLRGGSAVLLIEGTVENGGLTGALRTIHSELVGAERLRQADFDRGRWAVARRYNLGLETANDWVRNALAVAREGWDLKAIDQLPGDLATIDRAPLVSSLRRCSTEGVVSVIGDEPTVRRSLAEAWR